MPEIKGSAIEAVVADVKGLLETGRLERTELEVRLEAEDLKILDGKVLAGSWYPMASYARLAELLLEIEGRGDPDYLVRRGFQSAERLQATGIYAQLSANRERWGDRVIAILVSIGPAIYRDSKWTFDLGGAGDPFRFRIHVAVAPDFCEAARFAAQGFIQYLAEQNFDGAIRVTSRRASPTELVFTAR
jgi:hypothetical protein